MKGLPVRVLFVHEVNYSNKVIFEMHEFPELLALRGHDVTFFHYPESPDEPRRTLRTVRDSIAGRAYPAARLDLVTPTTFGGGPLERYAAPLLSLPALRTEIRSGRYDLVVLYAVPTTGWQTVAIARRAGVPVVFRALDVSHKIRSSPLAPLIRLAEKYIYRNATLISANNPAMADYCVGLSGRETPAIVNLPPVDLSHFEAVPTSELRTSLGLTPTDKVLLYMGSFFPFSGLETVIQNFANVMEAYPDLRLVLVGGGEQDAELRELTERLNLGGHVTFTGVVPYARLPEYLKIADVAINPFEPQLLTNVAFPHKVLQYMAAGVPTVSTSLTGLRGVLGEHSGVTWVPDSSEVVAAAIRLAYAEPEELAAVAAQQQAFIAATFSKEESVRSFEDTLERALHSPLERVG